VATVVNSDNVLQNNDVLAGIPITVQDGLKVGSPGSFSTIGIDNVIGVFDASSQAGNSFLVQNGGWACIEGAVGPDTTNKVLIAQITTDGVFSFELNMQLGTPDGGTEQFVAKDAIDLETLFQGLTYSSINTSIENPTIKNNADLVSIYPNPSKGVFNIDINSLHANSDNNYTLYNLTGNVILKKNIESISEKFADKIDLSTYPDGMYFVKVSIDNNISTIKLIKN
jgi:hypothetical protein